MSRTYLLFLDDDVIRRKFSYHQPRITLEYVSNLIEVDDSILLVSIEYEQAMPFLYKVLSANRIANTMTLQWEELYGRAFPVTNFLADYNNLPVMKPYRLARITPSQFKQLTDAM